MQMTRHRNLSRMSQRELERESRLVDRQIEELITFKQRISSELQLRLSVTDL